MVPLLPVPDMAAPHAFYRDVLGYRVVIDAPASRFAMIARDGARIGLQSGSDGAALAATRTHIACTVLVEDLDALWAEIAPRCADLPAGRVRPPCRQANGVREPHLKDPDGFLMLFSESG
jgi:catechol 2,3-dioxygenase-like lactoylglutathione lyase family enzyme